MVVTAHKPTNSVQQATYNNNTSTQFENALHFPVSVAPMMDYSDRHFRMLMRGITKKTLLYTEMVSTGAILHGDRDRHLAFSPEEKPLILQVGGDNPSDLAECTKIAADYGYDEINLNTGCPSERVQRGSFGAALMAKPEQVAEIVQSMCATNTIPVSVKCRIGIDGNKIGMPVLTDYEHLAKFARLVFGAGASRLTVHARIAILGGLSPKENRNIPPLRYPLVYSLAKEFSNFRIEINGGIHHIEEVAEHLMHIDGVMIGRAAVDNPFMFKHIDTMHSENKTLDQTKNLPQLAILPKPDLDPLATKSLEKTERIALARNFATYLEALPRSVYIHYALRHLMPIFNGMGGARFWRRAISLMMQKDESPQKAVEYALQHANMLAY